MKSLISITKLYIAVFLILIGESCNYRSSQEEPKIRKVTDMAGRMLEVPDTIKRVYVNRPGSVILYAVDPGITVCRSLWLTKLSAPFIKPSYAELPYTEGSVEEIVKFKPDIIISCFDINDKTKDDADKLQEKTGIPVFQIEIDMFKYAETFDILGDLLYRRPQTDRMKEFVHYYLDSIAIKAKLISEEKKVKVYYAEGQYGLETDPSGSKHSQVIDFVGGVNIAKVDILSAKGMSPVSMEQILLWDPEVILCWTGMGESMSTYSCVNTDKVWKTTRAVKAKKVYQIPYIPFGWIDRPPGTNRIMGTIWVANLLYPDVFNYNMEKVTSEYFEIFYHRELTNEDLQKILHPDPKGLADNSTSKHLKNTKHVENH